MAESVRRFLVGRDAAVTRRIFLVAAALTVTAFGTTAVPALWARAAGPAGAETMRLAAATAFLASVVAAVYLLAEAGDVNPYVPTGAVLLVLTGYGITGVVDGPELVFLLGPSLFLGVLAALAAFANDGALAALSIVFFPVAGYALNAPYTAAGDLGAVTRVQVALLFGLLFALSIGIAGFLVGAALRRVVDYAGLAAIEELQHPDDIR